MSYDNPLLTMTAGQIMCQSVWTVPADWSVDRLSRFFYRQEYFRSTCYR